MFRVRGKRVRLLQVHRDRQTDTQTDSIYHTKVDYGPRLQNSSLTNSTPITFRDERPLLTSFRNFDPQMPLHPSVL